MDQLDGQSLWTSVQNQIKKLQDAEKKVQTDAQKIDRNDDATTKKNK